MDRRAFFRRGIQRLGRGAAKEAMRRAERRAGRWIRPPFALDELEFLLACTRCGACTEACPERTIFPLGAHCGTTVLGTPALDLLNRGCRLCADWPCVAACEPGALHRPDEETDTQPRLARAWVDEKRCLPYQGPECGACLGSCPIPGALQWDGPRPRIEPSECLGCALCRAACIAEPKAIGIGTLAKAHEAAA